MLNDKDVLNYGLKKILELEALFLTKLLMYQRISSGETKNLIDRLISQETAHVKKLKELVALIKENTSKEGIH